jgi:hypothetical protein
MPLRGLKSLYLNLNRREFDPLQSTQPHSKLNKP